MSLMPRFPVYVISKGRYENCLTPKFLIKDRVPFHIVVEPQEFDEYAKRYGAERILVLPFSNLGKGGIPARNWVWEHAKAAGRERHWILDDNMRRVSRFYKQRRITCSAGAAFHVAEEFVSRYDNIAVAGLNYEMNLGGDRFPPFFLNCHVYSCLLIFNSLPYRWRGRYNEDTDLCLQVLANDWCTVLFNAFAVAKVRTMTMKGGNSDQLYRGDGRLKMASSLKRVWPGVVDVDRRYGRPQHVVRNQWKKFDTQLKLKPGVDLSKLKRVNNFGMSVVQTSTIKNKRLRDALAGDLSTTGTCAT